MNESDTRLKLIDPVLTRKWTLKRIRTEYYFTDGEICRPWAHDNPFAYFSNTSTAPSRSA